MYPSKHFEIMHSRQMSFRVKGAIFDLSKKYINIYLASRSFYAQHLTIANGFHLVIKKKVI